MPQYPKEHNMAVIQKVAGSAENTIGIKHCELWVVAEIESNFNNFVTNKFGFRGLFQFGTSAAKSVGLPYDQMTDPYVATQAVLRYMKQNSRVITAATGTEPETYQYYLAHQQGPGGFSAIWKAATGKSSLSSGIANNMAHNPPQDGKGSTTNPAEFIRRWKAVFDSKAKNYCGSNFQPKEDPRFAGSNPNAPAGSGDTSGGSNGGSVVQPPAKKQLRTFDVLVGTMGSQSAAESSQAESNITRNVNTTAAVKEDVPVRTVTKPEIKPDRIAIPMQEFETSTCRSCNK